MERIVSKPSNKKYRDRFDKVFRKKKKERKTPIYANNDPHFGG